MFLKLYFFAPKQQPYWHNISASSIARKFGVHPRTIIRRAKKFNILPGEISREQIKMLHKLKESSEATIFVRLTSEEQRERIKEEAKQLGMSTSSFLKSLVDQYFDGIKFERETSESKKSS